MLFGCPFCGQRLEAAPQVVQSIVLCPLCGRQLIIESTAALQPTAPAIAQPLSADTSSPIDTSQERAASSSPFSLQVIATLSIIAGCVCALLSYLTLNTARPIYPFGLVGLFKGIGLLLRIRFWRLWTLFFGWYHVIFAPIAAVWVLFAPQPTFTFWGVKVPYPSREIAFVSAVFALVIGVLEIKVMNSPRVRRLFGVDVVGGPSIETNENAGGAVGAALIALYLSAWAIAAHAFLKQGIW